ncbi:MAG: CBS domain-containing protein, partial [Thermoplasmata archaeon]
FTGVVFSLELTHDLNALLPLLVAALVADAFTVLVMKRSILTEKISRRGVHVSREYGIDPLERVHVRDVARTNIRSVLAELSVEEVLRVSTEPGMIEVGLSLVDEGGRYVGFLARSDLVRYVGTGGDPTAVARGLVLSTRTVCYPDEPLRIAVERLAGLDGAALPVMDPGEPSRVVGFVTREAPFEARILWSDLEEKRERVLGFPRADRIWKRRRAP